MNRSASSLLLFSILVFTASLSTCTPASVPPEPARQSVFPATLITPVVTPQAPTPTEMPPTAVPSPLPTGTPLPASPTPVTVPYDVPKPGQGGAGHGAGLFGIYPPLYIQPGDAFHATLACQEGASCDVEFALEYIDAAGKIHHDTGWSMRHQYGGGPVLMRVDLSPLAGQTVQLVLVVRDQGTPEDDWVLMVYPFVDHQGP